MLLFLDAAMGRRPSPLAAAFAAMLATREKAGNSMEVGLGWHIRSAGDTEIIWHNGGTGGYRSWMGYDPKSRSGVVVLTNAGTTAGPDDLGMHLISRTPLLPTFPPAAPPPTIRTETTLAPSTFDRYVGRYQLAPAAIVTISRDGSRFLAQLTGQPVFDIYAENDTKFFFKIVDAQLTFETDAQGKAQAVVLHQNGANQRAPRIEGDPVAPKEITLAAGVLDRHVGRYQFIPGVVISIRRQGTGLMAQITGQGAAEIYAESERRFFYKVVNAQLTFEPDAQGRTVAVVLHQNGGDQRAARLEDPKEIALEPAVLDRYVGRYQLGPATFLTITRNGARLVGQPTGQTAQEVIATGVNTFFVTGIGAEIVFEMDASGKPRALVVRQNGGDTRALRVEN
jgi:D-alanyl-D-alanine-carboxypeptidase/D-alanyl-D-alanine-endopeptidase